MSCLKGKTKEIGKMLFLEIAQLSRAQKALSQLNHLKKKSGTLSECQKVWIQMRTNILSVFIWIQTVDKGNQQTIKVTASQERFWFDSFTFQSTAMVMSRQSVNLTTLFPGQA